MLIPLVELKQTIDSWIMEGDPERISQGLKQLKKGGLFSAKNYYLGIGGKYLQSVRYDDLDTTLVRREKDARFAALLDVDIAIEAAIKRGPDPALRDASASLARFLDSCPEADVRETIRALDAFRQADADGNGYLNDLEFYSKDSKLTDTDRLAATWGVWSGAIADHLRPTYSGFVDLDLRSDQIPPVPGKFRAAIASMQF